ncbi:MAG: PIN domain-containing protein, partial [Beijerinckiaceae bacterium]|nr:PIN domain-containing protein [Beijerinckiaceae bacterium]
MKPFLDTNILVYAQQDDPRGDRARALVLAGGTISVQVLNEFANVLRKKLGRGWMEIAEALDDVRAALDPAWPLTIET